MVNPRGSLGAVLLYSSLPCFYFYNHRASTVRVTPFDKMHIMQIKEALLHLPWRARSLLRLQVPQIAFLHRFWEMDLKSIPMLLGYQLELQVRWINFITSLSLLLTIEFSDIVTNIVLRRSSIDALT